MTTTKRRQSIDIENSGNDVAVAVGGRTIVEVAIRGDGAADYVVEGRESKTASWVTTPVTYTGAADYDDTLETGWEELRIRCTSGTASAGEAAEIILCAGGK